MGILVVDNPDPSAEQAAFCAFVTRAPQLEIIVAGVFKVNLTYNMLAQWNENAGRDHTLPRSQSGKVDEDSQMR